MTEDEITQATSVFQKLPKDWSDDDYTFLSKMIAAGYRGKLKALRAAVEIVPSVE